MRKKMPLWFLLVVALLAFGTANAQNTAGTLGQQLSYVAGLNAQCLTLKTNTTYLVQARITSEQYSYNPYMFSSIWIWMSPAYTGSVVGTAPTDGGYVFDGGVTFWQRKPPLVLKDTDFFKFNTVGDMKSLCYQAGTTADGGVSLMTLTVAEVSR